MYAGRFTHVIRRSSHFHSHAFLRVSRPKVSQCRRFSSIGGGSASISSSSAGDVGLQTLAPLISQLDRLAPRFEVEAERVKILRGPVEFYEELKALILTAKREIWLSTLYVGKTEHDLIETLRSALRKNPTVRLHILTDALRGTRETPEKSCATLLVPLVEEFGPERVDIRMYHTPNLVGLRKKFIPRRINEGWGLQHMKLYAVDDQVMLSGANLSQDYFTDRQDRYHLFSSSEITMYFRKIYMAVCQLSFQALPDPKAPGGFHLIWPSSNEAKSPLEDVSSFCRTATCQLGPLLVPAGHNVKEISKRDTLVYPVSQFTQLLKPDTSTELPALRLLLGELGSAPFNGCRWMFTAGYFNMSPEIRTLLLRTHPSLATVVAASPWANGFYGSRGISGMLPAAYTYLAHQFLAAVERHKLGEQITVKEWRRGTVNEPGGWTYHAKGFWATLPGESKPSISLIGSSNYTKRSHTLDLETNALIITRNADLQQRLGDEERWLQEHAGAVDRDEFARPERRVRWYVRLAMVITTLVGGAL